MQRRLSGALLAREGKPDEHSREDYEDDADARVVAGEIPDRDRQEQDAREGVPYGLP